MYDYKTAVAVLAAMGSLGLAAAPASAATTSYTYTFGNGDEDLSTTPGYLYVTEDGGTDLGLTVTGHSYTIGEGGAYVAGSSVDVDMNAFGIISKNGRYEEHTVDSRGGWESMKFTFDGGKEVTLTEIVIGWSETWISVSGELLKHVYGSGGGNAEYDLFADGFLVGNTSEGAVVPAGPANVFAIGTRTLSALIETRCEYQLRGGDQTCSFWKDYDYGIKIRSITVEHDTPAIPLPAAGWLMLGALGGLGAVGRRRASA